MIQIRDMEKIECPFVRKMIGNRYLATNEIAEGMEWVFEDESVICEEKLHGTNVSIFIQDGVITSVWNRTERIPFFNKGKKHIIEGLLESYSRGHMEFLPDGQHFGECIGEKINGNPYKIKGHLWLPFNTFCRNHLAYKCWGKYPKTFESISEWFKELMPLYSLKVGSGYEVKNDGVKTGRYIGFVEGVVFHHPDGRMAKLRRDQFEWYKGIQHKELENA